MQCAGRWGAQVRAGISMLVDFYLWTFGREGDISETRPIVPRLAETRARSDPPRISAIRLVLAASLDSCESVSLTLSGDRH